ncbi:MAG: riboflavin synthase [Paracoccaceae bacterium]|jgi:riboflavin synthase
MFTGIVTDVGQIVSAKRNADGDLRVRIACRPATANAAVGASIACDGCCLTVVARGDGDGRGWFDADVSAESLSKTALGDWATGAPVNLERALKVGDELGGHIVSGHVDGVAEIVSVTPENDSVRVRLRAPAHLARFIAPKGSVALMGTSLTVNEVEGAEFGINLIPHTQQVTSWAGIAPGSRVNLEIDTLARYVARLRETEDMA